jgi:hypothetical protein
VADAVVDRLEVVEVEDDQREAAVVAVRAADLAGEHLVEVAPVVEPGEGVEVGKPAVAAALLLRARQRSRQPMQAYEHGAREDDQRQAGGEKKGVCFHVLSIGLKP